MTAVCCPEELEELKEWNWLLPKGKKCSQAGLGFLGNLSENPVQMRISEGSWIYEIGQG